MLDFLLNDEHPDHRRKIELDLAGKFMRYSQSKWLINHLLKLSMLNEGCQYIYLQEMRADRTCSYDSIGHLITCLDWISSENPSRDTLGKALACILHGGYDRDSSNSINRGCQRLIFALVYNQGYRKIANKVEPASIIEIFSPVIDSILDLSDLSDTAKDGMKRHVYINLFSHHPAGLAFLNVQSKELQGVPIHDGLQEVDELMSFCYTLAGPLHLFINNDSRKTLASVKAVDYFESLGYQINIHTAYGGFLSRDHTIGYLARKDISSIDFIEKGLTGSGENIDITIALSVTLMKPDVLIMLSDEAKIKVIGHVLRYIGKQFAKNPSEPNLSGCKESIAHVVRASPDIIPKIIDMMFENGLLIPKMYEWFGFGREEMKFVGNRANLFKGAILEQDLGM